MPRLPRGNAKPRWNFIDRTVNLADFTDGGGASGTYQLPDAIPVGAQVDLNAQVQVITAFLGDTTAVLTIGDGSDVDRYNTGTPSVFSTGYPAMGAPSGTKEHSAAIKPTLTVTSGSDFTLVTGGRLRVVMKYCEV